MKPAASAVKIIFFMLIGLIYEVFSSSNVGRIFQLRINSQII
jgi:hypothetical protein